MANFWRFWRFPGTQKTQENHQMTWPIFHAPKVRPEMQPENVADFTFVALRHSTNEKFENKSYISQEIDIKSE